MQTKLPKQDEAMEKIYKSRMALMKREPFFGHLVMSLKLRPMKAVPGTTDGVMGTNGTSLVFNPEWVCSRTEHDLMCILAHETLHVAMLHPIRREDRDPELWNIAADCIVNRTLTEHGYQMPADALVSVPGLHISPYDTSEDIYERLKEMVGNGGGGNGMKMAKAGVSMDAGDQPGEGEGEGEGQGDQPSQGPTSQEQEDVMRKVVEAAMAAREAGSMPASMERIVDISFHGQRDWRDELRKIIAGGAEKIPSWSRPNRRYIHMNEYLPGPSDWGPGEIVLAIDTSGSIDDELLSKFVAEVRKINEDIQPEKIHVVCCDAQVQWTQTYTSFDEIEAKPVGRGGTRFSPVFDWVEQQGIHPRALIYFTDLQCSDFGEPPSYDVRWVVWPDGSSMTPPFGERVNM